MTREEKSPVFMDGFKQAERGKAKGWVSCQKVKEIKEEKHTKPVKEEADASKGTKQKCRPTCAGHCRLKLTKC